jgi:uncharacterized membrane protein YqaE (UPF0057 family)
MTATLQWFNAHKAMIAAYIAMLLPLLATLATGLSNYPKEQSFVRALLDLLSFSTHKDSPDSLKLPLLMRSRPPSSTKSGVITPPLPPAAVVLFLGGFGKAVLNIAVMLTLLGYLISLSSCCYFKGTCKAQDIGQALIDCTTQSLSQEMIDIMPAVIAVLESGSPDWAEQLAALEKNGEDAIICVVSKLVAQIKNPPPGSALPEHSAVILSRGEQYLAKKNRKVKLGP